jgi:hypothetical protein
MNIYHRIHQGRGRQPLPDALKTKRHEEYRGLIFKLNALGLPTKDIAEALNVSSSYVNMMHERQAPPLHILAALREVLIVEMQKAEARKRAEADRIAIERQALLGEAKGELQ